MITLAIVVFFATLLTSCGSKAYKENKKILETFEKAIDKAETAYDLEDAYEVFSDAEVVEFACPHIGSDDFVPEHLAPAAYLLFNNEVNSWLGIGYAAGAEWDGSTAEPTAFWALTLSFAPADRWGFFVESYNRARQTRDELLDSRGEFSVDFGVTYMLLSKLQLDMAANINLQRPDKLYELSAGVAWQIN